MKQKIRIKEIESPRTKEPFLVYQLQNSKGSWKGISKLFALEMIDEGQAELIGGQR